MHTNISYVKPATSLLAAANVSSAARDIDVTCSDVTPLVFVVDDQLSVRESLELLMGTEGWRVETFASAADFVSRSRATVPCCLVLDIRLPGLEGLVVQWQLAAGASVRIVFLTG